MYTVPPSAIVSLPTVVHDLPSADSYAVIVLPLRESFTHRGAVEALPAVFVLVRCGAELTAMTMLPRGC